ncbi:hypothetical protein RFI_21649 [Reticulomyxa filosa]|uniref:pyridoxal 5'-phosphate synthase n=1 Tax=Reticulomyxa filosa TaxID=46433 RepID=X6MRI3_RETFI|nr:hypothetical protein RFI_21649 [Reticulomyxa filosa]|eukprot:ETO15715.1 hypothetical protein RFI_21649 [Reticulomyxa filosa]
MTFRLEKLLEQLSKKEENEVLRNDVYLSMKNDLVKNPPAGKKKALQSKKKEVKEPSQDLEDRLLRNIKNIESTVAELSQVSTNQIMSWFQEWFSIAQQHPWIGEPNAMCISTISTKNLSSGDDKSAKSLLFPDSRFVLLKGRDNSKGVFTFFTNYESNKGKQLTAYPQCSLLFYWEPLHAAVRVQGVVEKTSDQVSDEYWNSRPYQSQLCSAVSEQSRTVENRGQLEKKLEQLNTKCEQDQKVPRPKHWGGFYVTALQIEFWKSGPYRFHHRVVFTRQNHTQTDKESWQAALLQP